MYHRIGTVVDHIRDCSLHPLITPFSVYFVSLIHLYSI
nr:MAG TPA: hypothetical protein [Caudoviricetes sp.]